MSTPTSPRCQTDAEIYAAGLRAASQLPPASPGAVERVARLLSAALLADNRTEEHEPAA
jgi:hypothetical protein